MGKKHYTQLTLEERCQIALLQKEGKTIRQIAAIMARAPSTIARELKRNTTQTLGYQPRYAQQQTAGRRWQGARLEREPALRTAVVTCLAMGWSPQQVANRLAQAQGCKVISYESIYRFIDTQLRRTKDYRWRHYLPRAKSRRGWRQRKITSSAVFIKERVSIANRPCTIAKRTNAGHWEADLMLFAHYGQALLVAHERYSRLLLLFKLKDKKAKRVIRQLMDLFRCLPSPLAKTITFDNGTEFAEHYQLKSLGMKTYFCDVRSPWQKGGIENAIGRLRRPLPRKTDLAQLKNRDIERLVALYNHTPRKCLGYKTPAEVFTKQLLHFKCEFTFPPARE